LKWSSTQAVRGTYTFSAADSIVEYAVQNGMLLRGHTLVWHRSLPKWVERITDPEELTSVLTEHITTVMSRYAGKIYAWDVVNEPFLEDGSLRPNHFFNILGERYIGIAFRAARQADPQAKLYLNDYTVARAKIAGAAKCVAKWINEGVPIDGIGAQCHVSKGEGDRVGWTLQALAEGSGVAEVAVTELDIEGGVVEDWLNVLKGVLECKRCVGVTTWSVRDEESWRKECKPCLFEGEGKEKEVVGEILRLLHEERSAGSS
jgi:endo-1,4-beta-xylanase